MIENKYAQRLFEEWIKHQGIILGLDFDDTLFPYRKDFTDCQKVIDLVKECVKYGAQIIINTASAKERYSFIKDYLVQIGITPDKLNENIIMIFGDNRKIYANIYLDDRAGLESAMEILSSALEEYKKFTKEN